MHEVLAALAGGRAVPARALARLDDALRRCHASRRLRADDGAAAWAWLSSARASDEMLAPILEAAIDLITSPLAAAVRQCHGSGCGWLFLDRSPAQRRRWCSMSDCGNRAKARAHYQRHSAKAPHG